MVRERVQRVAGARGYSAIDLLVLVTVMGIVSVAALPSLLATWRASALAAGVAELATVLNRARQIAVAENTSVCVQSSGVGIRLRMPGCAGAVWTGPGTDTNGAFRSSNDLEVEAGGPIVFTHLGAAAPAGTFAVRDRATGRTRLVVVAATGQVSTP